VDNAETNAEAISWMWGIVFMALGSLAIWVLIGGGGIFLSALLVPAVVIAWREMNWWISRRAPQIG
jgi:hypothetical protein